MGESNSEWGALVDRDPEIAEVWDTYERLPEPGVNDPLDHFCKRKNITIPSLVRLGAKLSDPHVLAFAFPGGLKFRDIITDRRWAYAGSTWDSLKVVRSQDGGSDTIIICEGETDGARLSEIYGDSADVGVLPAGALTFKQSYADQVSQYDRVLVGLDSDEAGEKGAKRIAKLVPRAIRFAPPANDWCSTQDNELPALASARPQADIPILVNARDLMELEEPLIASWYENAVLPVGGLMVVHGWAKSFKTFITLDMMAKLAQGEPWAGFEPTEEPCRVAVIQFELTWPYYRQRILQVMAHAQRRDLLKDNFMSYSPLARPQIIAGNTAQEDYVIAQLVEAGIQVVMLDPIRRATGEADMNSESEVRKMLGFFERINDEGITVVATHHDNKQAGRSRGGDPIGMTGSGAWIGDPDSIVSIELPRGDDPRTSTRRNLHFTLRNAPSVGGRAFMIEENGQITYDTNLWDDDEDIDAPGI